MRLRRVLIMGLLLSLLGTGFTYPRVPAGRTFQFRSTKVALEARAGTVAVPREWVEYAITHHSYSQKVTSMIGADFPIFLADQAIRMEGGEPLAVAGTDGFILIGGMDRPDRAVIEQAVIHELGHILVFHTMTPDRWKVYRSLRGLGDRYLESAPWEQRPSEIIAEDFAFLFGTGRATHRPWRMGRLPEPQTVEGLREFFLRLVDDPAAPAPDAATLALVDRNRPINRAEWVYELAQAVPAPSHQRYRLPSDWMLIPKWAGQAVITGLSNGWIHGYPDGTFLPDEPVTRGQAAQMLQRVLPVAPRGRRRVSYRDASAWPVWAREAIVRVQRLGIMPPRPDGRFDPDAPLSAAEALAIIEKLRLEYTCGLAGTCPNN